MNYSTKLYTIPRGGAICKFVFALMCCVMMAMQSYGQEVEAYAVYKYGTLTFYCDDQRANRESSDETFDLPSLSNPPQSPEWLAYDPYISRVVFDKSFKKARPKTCYRWFNLSFLEDIKDIKYLNTSEVENMAWMFSHSQRLLEIDLSHFDTRKVTDMSYMFHECTGFTELNLSSFNTENVKDMSYMFFGMFNDQFTELDLSSFIVKDILRNTEAMFAGCKYLKTIKVSSGWEPSWVTAIESQYMFSECYDLVGEQNTQADVGDYDIEYARIDGGPSRPGFFTTGKPCEPYAILSADGTLTLKFDEKRPEKSYDIGYDYWKNDVNFPNITKVEFAPSFAYYRPTSCYNWFCKMENLEKIEGINEYLNTSQVTSMGGMFYKCFKLTGELNLSNFDTQNVTDMSNMFAFCGALTKIDINGFNTSSVTNMYWMFMNCDALETIEIGDEWNTGNVTSMSGLFGGCTNLKFDFTKLNTTSVIYMDYMLRGWNTKEFDLSTFETGNVTIMQGMFAGCSNLERIIIDPVKFNTEKVQDMGWMFDKCRNLEILDLRSFNTEKVVDMREMFSGCEKLTTILVDPSHWNINNVDRYSTFGSSDPLAKNIPPFENTPNLIGNNGAHNQGNSYDYAIANTENSYLTTDSYKIFYDLGEDGVWKDGIAPQSSFDIALQDVITINTTPVSKKGQTFKGWYGTPITGLTKDDPKKIITIKAGEVGNRIYTAVWDNKIPYVVISPDEETLTFYYDEEKDNKKEGKVYTLDDVDENGHSPAWLKVIEVRNNGTEFLIDNPYKTVVFDKSFKDFKPTSCSFWFFGSHKLEEIIGLENLNTDEVTSMRSMFSACNVLESLNLSNFNTNNVTDMDDMFGACRNLKELDISSFNTTKVEFMDYMFEGCDKLQTIFVGDGWSTESVTSSENMFLNCSPNLRGGQCTPFNEAHTDVDYARIDGFEGKPGYFTKKGDPVCTLINKIANSQILTQNFTIPAEISTLDADISQLDDFCKGTQSPITLQIKTGAVVDKYEISIDGGNTSQGETPKPTISTDTIYNINVDIKNIKSGIHTGSIKLWEGENWFEDTFALQVTAAQNVIMHLYTDVIFVNNGDRLFLDQWQWYKNEKTITNANYQYLYDTEMSGNTYMCKIKTKDGVDVYTCPFTEPISKNLSASVTIAPNPASEVEPVNISIANFDPETDYTISIYNSNGMVVRTIYHANQTNAISLKSGIYSGALIYNSTKKGFKLIVR